MGSFTVSVGGRGDVRMSEDGWTSGEKRLLSILQWVLLLNTVVIGGCILVSGFLNVLDCNFGWGVVCLVSFIVLSLVNNQLIRFLTWTENGLVKQPKPQPKPQTNGKPNFTKK